MNDLLNDKATDKYGDEVTIGDEVVVVNGDSPMKGKVVRITPKGVVVRNGAKGCYRRLNDKIVKAGGLVTDEKYLNDLRELSDSLRNHAETIAEETERARGA